MTLYHFGNCLALIYAPYHMAYKFSGISEYASFSKCVYAGGLYIFTQLCKMLFLATFFPDSDSGNLTGEYDLFMEFLKATVDFADLFGLYFALNSVPGKGHAKILTAAIGWASAEVIVTRSVGLWAGARGAEFDWRHVRGAVAANVALLRTIATAALVWSWSWSWSGSRREAAGRGAALGTVLLALAPYQGLVERALVGRSHAWPRLALRAAHAAGASLVALTLYAGRA